MKNAEEWWEEFRLGNPKSGPRIIEDIRREILQSVENECSTRAYSGPNTCHDGIEFCLNIIRSMIPEDETDG